MYFEIRLCCTGHFRARTRRHSFTRQLNVYQNNTNALAQRKIEVYSEIFKGKKIKAALHRMSYSKLTLNNHEILQLNTNHEILHAA